MTSHCSAFSVVVGEGIPLRAPGTSTGPKLVVEGTDAAHAELAGRGAEVGELQQLGPEGAPGSRSWSFKDPDGNGWPIQELETTRASQRTTRLCATFCRLSRQNVTGDRAAPSGGCSSGATASSTRAPRSSVPGSSARRVSTSSASASAARNVTPSNACLDGREKPQWREQGTGSQLDALARVLAPA